VCGACWKNSHPAIFCSLSLPGFYLEILLSGGADLRAHFVRDPLRNEQGLGLYRLCRLCGYQMQLRKVGSGISATFVRTNAVFYP